MTCHQGVDEGYQMQNGGMALHLFALSNAIAVVHFVHCTFEEADDELGGRECGKERSTTSRL